MNSERLNLVVLLCFPIVLTGCSASTKHTVHKDTKYGKTGISVQYNHPRNLVFRAAKEAVEEAGFSVITSEEDDPCLTAESKGGLPLLRVGEYIDICVEDKGYASTRLTIKSTPRTSANLIANLYDTVPHDFSAEILASITEKLNSLSTGVSSPEKTPQKKFETPEADAQGSEATRAPVAKRWAVIIGISNYSDLRIPPLRYAKDNAKAFYDWAISPDGGRYAPLNVKLLLDEHATGMNIRDALFVWLKQALEEDMVTIYFAGHGSPEAPDSSNNLFLLSYDADYNNVAATGFPMWDVETALKRFISARKVVVIADACHAAGIGQSFDVARRTIRDIVVNPINSGLQNLSRIGDGVCVISASDDNQYSQESHNWGGGHGVFTYFLLSGLRGEADYNKDNSVTLGELIPFLSEQVRRATKNAQCPTVVGKLDNKKRIRSVHISNRAYSNN